MSYTLRVVSFNIKVATDSNISALARDLVSLDPDLCALQEVGAHWSMGTPVHQGTYLASAQGHDALMWLPLLERLWSCDPYRGGPFTFSSLTPNQPLSERAGHFGVALSARGTFTETRVYHLRRAQDEQRGLLEAQWIPTGTFMNTTAHETDSARPLTIYCVHLSVIPEERLAQVDELIEITQANSGPALLLGDLNDTPDSEALRRLYAASWRDLYTESRAEQSSESVVVSDFTFSVQRPERRLDYILGRDVECTAAGIAHAVRSSDHFPIWADVTW